MKHLFAFLFSILLVVVSATPAQAQATGSIAGRVEDASGAGVPAATVTVRSVETGSTRTVTTDRTGNYSAPSLSVGQYEVRTEKPGFRTVVRSGISLAVEQEAVVNVKLDVGEVVQELTVTEEIPVVNTTTSPVSGLVGERQVKELPLNGRSFDNLIALNPGAISFTSMRAGPQNGTGEGNYFSVSGRKPYENVFLLNGIEYTGTSAIAVTPGGVSGQLLGIDAVREFNVLGDTYSAEYGKRAGAQVSVITQSGTNQLHGSLFEFLRNSALDARNFFDQGPIPGFERNQFGGAVGGPLRKDKMFVFGNYEGFRQRLGISDVTFVPDQNARRGLQPDGTPVPGLDRRMLAFMSFWPEPNGENLGSGIAKAYSNPNQTIREDFGTIRADHIMSDRDSFSGAYTVDDGRNVTPLQDPLFAVTVQLRSQVASVQETHLFSSRVINTARVGFSRAAFFNNSAPFQTSLPADLSFFNGEEPGNITVGGANSASAASITSAGAANNPNTTSHRNLFTYDDHLQITRGIHQIGAGIWFQGVRINDDLGGRRQGQAVFSTLTSFLQGTLNNFTAVVRPTPLSWRSLEGAWFVEDAVKLRPNLTLRLGLRHEFTNGYNEASGRAANYPLDANGVLVTNPRVADSAFTENNAKRLFSPRVGLAWDPFGKGKTAVRAGFGMYYNLIDNLSFMLQNVPPFNGVSSVFGGSLFSVIPISRSAFVPPSCGPQIPQPCTTYSPQGVPGNMQTPATLQWNFTVEQQLTRSMVLDVGYVGSHGYHNIINPDLNTVPPRVCSTPAGCTSGGVGSARGTVPQGAEYIPVVATRPNPYLSNGSFWYTQGSASYHALQVDVTRRLSRGLQFRGNYAWSKSMDISSGLASSQALNQTAFVLNRFNLKREWGLAGQDVRHRVSANFSYALPFGRANKFVSGWQLNTIVTLQTGFPFTALVTANRSGDGNARNPDRPDVNPNFTGKVLLRDPNHWFDPHAFLLPTAGTYGNLGRATLTGPGLAEVDPSLVKNTALTERVNLQFRAEFFNVFNHSNFSTPNPAVFQGAVYSPSAGVITSESTTSRQIQFGLKLIF